MTDQTWHVKQFRILVDPVRLNDKAYASQYYNLMILILQVTYWIDDPVWLPCRSSFIVIAVLDLIALACSVILFLRTRHIYRLEYLELHLHDEEMDARFRHEGHSSRQFGGNDLDHSDSESGQLSPRDGQRVISPHV